MAYNFTTIEKKWQQYWLANKSFRALDPDQAGDMPKAYVLDMFPYPSGAGLHVGHPEGYTATDIYSRYLRMRGFNVLHPMGWDAFGLPAEQYAIKTNTHPRVTTEQNISNFRRQIQSLGLSYDWDREVDTTDPNYYRWTQWIFLQIFNSYFDPVERKAKPIGHLMQELVNENYVVAPDGSIHLNPTHEGMERLSGDVRIERLWRELSPEEQREVIDNQRLAYMAEVPVNWCSALGTVLANEEVIDGKSEVGGFPVERRPLRQWMLKITAYADRLLEDLDTLDWPESLKEMQRNWIGKSVGAEVDFAVANGEDSPVITVFTTRPDTLYGVTYMVLAPEHSLVDEITTPQQRQAVEAYRAAAASRSDRDRAAETKDKTGVFTGAYAINPVNNERIPIWIADYVLMSYGTGAVMAVPAHDERDYEFAKENNLPIKVVVVRPFRAPQGERLLELAKPHLSRSECVAAGYWDKKLVPGALQPTHEHVDRYIRSSPAVEILADDDTGLYFLVKDPAGRAITHYTRGYEFFQNLGFAQYIEFSKPFVEDGIAVNSPIIDGLPTPEAKERIIAALAADGVARRSVKYKLRDWLFSRQRYWGEPFPILLDEDGNPHPVDESELPVTLPEIADFKPTGTPEPPLSKVKEWLHVERNGKIYQRETNTMPQWAGSCWYYLRYIDPDNGKAMVDRAKEKYWLPVDLYVGGVEHAVLHLLYARFWHKMLFDLGHVSTAEPFQRLVNQGLILGEMELHLFTRPDGTPVSASVLEDIREEALSEGPRLVGTHKTTGERYVASRIGTDLVEKRGERFVLKSDLSIVVEARAFKMSKSRGNVVNPDEIVKDYGADCFRLYEMYMGPLEAQKPWNTRDIVGMSRFLNSVWRNLVGDEEQPGGASRISDGPIPDAIERQMHRTIKKVAEDVEGLRFNTAIAELIKLNNEITGLHSVPRSLAEAITLMLAPFAPHMAEELWQRLGHEQSLARQPWPVYDSAKLVETTMDVPVQVNGKLRDRVTVPATATEEAILAAAESAEKIRPWLEGKTVVKRLYVPKKLVNFVVK